MKEQKCLHYYFRDSVAYLNYYLRTSETYQLKLMKTHLCHEFSGNMLNNILILIFVCSETVITQMDITVLF